jgi:hypothetical protein
MAAMAKKLKKAKVPVFDAQSFLNSAGVARRIVEYRDSQKVYSQGYLNKLRRLIGKSDESNRKLSLHMVQKMAKH